MTVLPGVVRDSFLGTFVYFLSGRRYFRHPEELSDFVLPTKYDSTQLARQHNRASYKDNSDAATLIEPAGGDLKNSSKRISGSASSQTHGPANTSTSRTPSVKPSTRKSRPSNHQQRLTRTIAS
ncbi:hypothetical protein PHLGIDRAFT_274087 [Phlebiopsis gigantea 11061_1 CR5-6]|uniref:Uncharacterized protein n=1 Tax=Phlebiopsis gigantea (strain 11061_1 CR5-6) TaxID=745531 RepID=A0A0C3SE18_PHLG1|nr:hypothetical protein PHLGIDRAFT_274087 [Phlebiopsis gigantea 11061_1 CR5-6]